MVLGLGLSYAGSAVILYGGTHLGDTYYWEVH